MADVRDHTLNVYSDNENRSPGTFSDTGFRFELTVDAPLTVGEIDEPVPLECLFAGDGAFGLGDLGVDPEMLDLA